MQRRRVPEGRSSERGACSGIGSQRARSSERGVRRSVGSQRARSSERGVCSGVGSQRAGAASEGRGVSSVGTAALWDLTQFEEAPLDLDIAGFASCVCFWFLCSCPFRISVLARVKSRVTRREVPGYKERQTRGIAISGRGVLCMCLLFGCSSSFIEPEMGWHECAVRVCRCDRGTRQAHRSLGLL